MNSKSKLEKEIIAKFIFALETFNIELLTNLLYENGKYEIQDLQLETIESNKQSFLNWIEEKLKQTKINTITHDQCLHCKIGNPVVILNNGKFPRNIKDSSERSKTGLMLEIENEKISQIKFCYTFTKTENRYQFECEGTQLKKYMEQGLTFEEAYKKTFNANKLE